MIRAALVTAFGLRGLERRHQQLIAQIEIAERRARQPATSRDSAIDDLVESR